MRSRTLTRPMFRMGGSSGTGITSGLDRPGYQQGGGADARFFIQRPMAPAVDKKPTGLGLGTIPGFITQFGLNLASQAPTGNIFSTAAAAAKEPFETFQQAKFAEAKEEREFEREKQLQLLKNLDEDDRIQIQKEAQVLADNPESEFFGQYNKALNMLAQKKVYGVQFMPGEERKAAIKKRADELRAARVPDIIATRQATFFVDFPKVEKANPDISFDIEQPFFIGADQKYKEGFVYYDPIGQIYLRRDSTITGGETPGFENITGEIK
tara:strand:- start:3718 stop:4521 length:804 start_codon:yes stop_codon:yes gene_type:complete